jgi:WD40 repeat protein
MVPVQGGVAIAIVDPMLPRLNLKRRDSVVGQSEGEDQDKEEEEEEAIPKWKKPEEKTGLFTDEEIHALAAGCAKIDSSSIADFVLQLDVKKLGSLRREFVRMNDSLSLYDFVRCIRSLLPNKMLSEETTSHLVELFAEIDVSGDHSLQWEEFMGYISDASLIFKSSLHTDDILQYREIPLPVQKRGIPQINRVQYLPTLDKYLCAESSGVVKLFRGADLQPDRNLEGHEGLILDACDMGSRNSFATSATDSKLAFWDPNTLKPTMQLRTYRPQLALAWNESESMFYSGSVDGTLYYWDPDTMNEILYVKGHSEAISALEVVPEISLIASGSYDKLVKIWDCGTGKLRQTLVGHNKGIYSMAYSSDYHFLMTGGYERDIHIWNPFVKKLVTKIQGHFAALVKVEVMPGYPQIISTDCSGITKIWDIRNFQCVQTLVADKFSAAVAMTVDTHRHRIVLADHSHFGAFEYDKAEDPFRTHGSACQVVRYNRSFKSIFTASGSEVKVWKASTGELVRVTPGTELHNSEITALCFDERMRKLFLGFHDGSIRSYACSSGALLKQLSSHDLQVTELIYIGESRTLLSASWDKTLMIHDEDVPGSRQVVLKHYFGHKREVTCADYSVALHLVVSGSNDRTCRVWDYNRGLIEAACTSSRMREICAVRFLGDTPTFLASDVMGAVYLVATRPYPWRYTPLLCFSSTLENIKETPGSAALCIAYSAKSTLLAIGCDSGLISVGNIEAVLKTFWLADSTTHWQHLCEGGTVAPSFDFKTIESSIVTFNGGNESIMDICILEVPQIVLAASADGLVRLFDFYGHHRGSLSLSHLPGDKWTFHDQLFEQHTQRQSGEQTERLQRLIDAIGPETAGLDMSKAPGSKNDNNQKKKKKKKVLVVDGLRGKDARELIRLRKPPKNPAVHKIPRLKFQHVEMDQDKRTGAISYRVKNVTKKPESKSLTTRY